MRGARRIPWETLGPLLGKGEVESSILSHSAISLFGSKKFPKHLKGKDNFGVPYTPF